MTLDKRTSVQLLSAKIVPDMSQIEEAPRATQLFFCYAFMHQTSSFPPEIRVKSTKSSVIRQTLQPKAYH
jgi:hypothetical protein